MPAVASWKSLYPFASHYAAIAGHQLHYVDEYVGPAEQTPAKTLLFVHGNPTWSFHWRSLILGLRNEYRCVAVDHLGCGLSDQPAETFRLADRIEHLSQLIAQLDLKNVTLVAQDWGGAIGLGAMQRHLSRLDRAMLINTGAFPPWFIPARIRVCRAPLLGRIGLQGANLFSRAALRMTTPGSGRLPADVEAGYLAPYDSWAHRRAVYDFVADIPTGPKDPTWETLKQVEEGLSTMASRPILLTWGMRDWCFTPACLERFQQHWPHAITVEFPEAGHWLVEEQPQALLRELQVHLKR